MTLSTGVLRTLRRKHHYFRQQQDKGIQLLKTQFWAPLLIRITNSFVGVSSRLFGGAQL